MTVSRREYARLRGVSDMAVRKAIQAGRITLEPDGRIDPAKADREWASTTDPARQRGREAQQLALETAAETAALREADARAPKGMKAVPAEAIEAAREALREEGKDDSIADPNTGQFSFAKARAAKELIATQLLNLRLQRERGILVEKALAEAMFEDEGRRERDMWQAWPARVAANMAADLGIDAHALETVLDAYIRAHLETLAELRISLVPGR